MQIRVLHVDDEVSLGRALKVLLAPEFELTSVQTLEAAKEAFTNSIFDVLLLDLGLDDSDGPETVRRARAFCDLPIVVLTGQEAGPEDRLAQDVSAAGADFYLDKISDVTLLKRFIRLSLLRRPLSVHMRGKSQDICARIHTIEASGALVCYCSFCDKVMFIVESNTGSLVCPHCNQRTLMQWGRATILFEPELPPRELFNRLK